MTGEPPAPRTPVRLPANGVVIYTEERAEREAAAGAAARARPGHRRRPLEGVSVAYKDNIDLAGLRTVGGSAARAAEPPARRDAEVARRLSAAGAVTVAKTHLAEHAFNGLGTNARFGTPDNPRAPGHLPGGSSSGTAVAVATGLATVGMGTDTSGSVRVPAALCGLVGYRPSQARYPRAGVLPLAPSLDTVGVMTRDMRQLLAADAALSPGLPRPSPGSTRGLTLLVPEGELYDRLTPAVRDTFEAALEAAAAAGVTIRRARLTTTDVVLDLHARCGPLVAHEAAATLAPYLEDYRARFLDPRVRERLEEARALATPGGRRTLLAARPRLQSSIAGDLEGALLALPTTPCTAPRHRDIVAPEAWHRLNREVLLFTMLTSYLDMPGVTLPLPPIDGLPAGLLLSAPTGHDAPLLVAAAALEKLARTPR